ncbi:amidohydrolase [Sphingomonas sp. ID0503]|uniref:amidohydrolase n=1 Tax=Sphingomonas sp. ID0503 TaxID=3399691 RepID=UPI003AFAA673
MRALALALVAVLALAAPAAAKKRVAAPVDTTSAGGLVDNVNGYTLDKAGKLVRFDGMLVKSGKVVKLLGRGDKRPAYLDFRLDGQGRTLIPGLIDGHGHVMGLGFSAIRLDLTGAASLGELQAKLRAYAAERPNLKWITGGGWNQELWPNRAMPTAADLDAVVPDRPVWLERVDGHASVGNTLALREAGVTAASKAPEGGRIEMAAGQPTGLFIDKAQDLVAKFVPPPLPREADTAFAKAQDILLGYGITAIADMGTSFDDWNTYRRSGDAGRLRVRIISYSAGVEPAISIAGTGPTPWLYGDRLRMVGVKLYDDGALGSRGAWLKVPYADRQDQKGLSFLDDAKLRNLMSRAAMDNLQVAVHAIGDAANAQVLDAIEELSDTYKGDRRWRIEHAQVVDSRDIQRYGKFGTIASMQPVHETSDRLMAEARLGPDRLAGAYAWASIARAGAPLAFGSDVPVEKPDPFAGIATAMTRQDEKGAPAGGWQPQEKVTLEQAFAAYTKGAAFAGFAEDRLGSLEPGHHADFLLLDRDIFTVTAEQIRATKVMETWIGGARVWTAK